MTTDAPSEVVAERTHPRRLLIGGLVAAVLMAGGAVTALVVTQRHRTPTRQEVVAQRGPSVMPFDLNATSHQFESTPTGAVETVTANRADDTTQVDSSAATSLAKRNGSRPATTATRPQSTATTCSASPR